MIQTVETDARHWHPSAEAHSYCEVRQRCVAILRCTARALLQTPGGLRFRAGSQPWLEGLELPGQRRALN